MKQVFWCAGIMLLINTTTVAQTKSKRAKAKQAVPSQTSQKNKADELIKASDKTVTLNTTASYPAKSTTSILSSAQKRFMVTDPILATLDKRANGANISFNKSGIVGMPKRAYGFANGRIILTSTGAVTSGTQTGSGGVGTGTSMATFGSIGAPMNVNGKSPYAGINMWGNAMNMTITRRDSSVRVTHLRKQ